MPRKIVRNGTDFFLTLVALLLAAATLYLVFAEPPGPPPAVEAAAPTAAPELAGAGAAQDVAASVDSVPEPLAEEVAAEVAVEEIAAVAADSAFEVFTDPYDQLYNEHYRQIATLVGLTNDPYVRIVVRPIERPDLEVNFGGNKVQNAASTMKAPVLLYAIFRDPQIAMTGWQGGTAESAYRMIVGSANSATATVLVESGGQRGSPVTLDRFNDFLHDIVGLPPSVGLTQWNYGATSDMLSFNVAPRDPAFDPERVAANPITLDALVAFYEFLETPNWIEGAISRAIATEGYPMVGEPAPEAYRADVLAAIVEAKQLMTIPDPERATEIELALARAQIAHPELEISMYGKNGLLRPEDWPGDRWHVNEAAVVTVAQGERSLRCIVAYSASRLENDHLLDGVFNYCVDLFEQGAIAGN